MLLLELYSVHCNEFPFFENQGKEHFSQYKRQFNGSCYRWYYVQKLIHRDRLWGEEGIMKCKIKTVKVTLQMPQKVKQEPWCFETRGRRVWGGAEELGFGNAKPVTGKHTPYYRRQLWEGGTEWLQGVVGKYASILFLTHMPHKHWPLTVKAWCTFRVLSVK